MSDNGFRWECKTVDGKTFSSVKDHFDLSWEKPGIVFSFKVIINDKSYSINLSTGEFNVDGDVNKFNLDCPNFPLTLRYFKRNLVSMNMRGETLGSKVCYGLGYRNGDSEKILLIDPSDSARFM